MFTARGGKGGWSPGDARSRTLFTAGETAISKRTANAGFNAGAVADEGANARSPLGTQALGLESRGRVHGTESFRRALGNRRETGCPWRRKPGLEKQKE